MDHGRQGIERVAARFALLGAAFLSTLALLAGAVRVLPLVVDPELPIGVAFPFAKAVAWLGLEVALATGWVVGWALAFARFVDRGEARVHALLGRSPGDVARGLVPQAAILACAVVAASYLAARDAEAPGRVVAELVSSGRDRCLAAEGAATTIPVPFLDARWLCAPGETPRLLLHPPQIGTALVTASDATISGDLREARLVDARIRTSRAEVSVRELLIKRMPPLLTSASVKPWARAIAVAASSIVAAFGVDLLVLSRRIKSGAAAVALGGAASAATFAVLRGVDRAGASSLFLLGAPIAAWGALAIGSAVCVSLRRKWATATTK